MYTSIYACLNGRQILIIVDSTTIDLFILQQKAGNNLINHCTYIKLLSFNVLADIKS